MHIFRLVLISLIVAILLFACKKTETGSVKKSSPAYGTEETTTPAYEEAKTPAYGETKAPAYGEAKAPAYGEAEIPGYGRMADNIEKGNPLFNDPTLGSSKNAKSCNTCHPGGKGLEMSGSKSKFNIMDMEQNSLEEAINICIVMPLQGKEIDPNGQDMKDIVAYIRSLKK